MDKSAKIMAAGWVLAMLLALPAIWSPAWAGQAQPAQVKLDTQTPVIRPPDAKNLCPPNFATFHLPGGTRCAQCGQGYTALVSRGSIICVRGETRPLMRVPDGYQPEFHQPDAKGGCPRHLQYIELPGRKACVQCKPGHRFHPYYGQGRCVTCKKGGESLEEIGGKIMCLSCPGNSSMVGRGRPGGPYESVCTCRDGGVFGWGPQGYGCYPLP